MESPGFGAASVDCSGSAWSDDVRFAVAAKGDENRCQ